MKKDSIFYLGGILLLVIFFILIVFFIDKNNGKDGDKILITTSFYPIYFITSQIGGDLVKVENLVPNGIEPHDYELTSGDIIKIKKSKLLIINGGGVEVWKEDVLTDSSNNKKAIVLIDRIKDDLIENDPHIWLSPNLAIKMAEVISFELAQVDPENANYYKSNLNTLKVKLFELNNDFKSGLSSCKKKDIVTSHEAFGYLVRDYNLNQVAISGLSTEEEPSIEKMTEISQFVRNNGIEYIFFESLVSPELSETIASEVGAQTLVLNPLEGLTEKELSLGGNYFSEMRRNLDNLRLALDCE